MIRRPTNQVGAFSIVETVFSILLVSGVVVAALNSVGAATSSRHFVDGKARGQLLAESLMTEIMAQGYVDDSGAATLGPEMAEVDVDRNEFDDVDDYRNYIDSPPKNREGELISGFSNWSRTVSVVLADPVLPNNLAAEDAGVKKIKITVKCDGVPVATLVAFKTGTDPVAGKSKQTPINVANEGPVTPEEPLEEPIVF